MDGLECSEINLSELLKIITLRFDSEYFKKKYLSDDKFIAENPNKFVNLNQLSLSVDASAFYPALEPYYNTGNIPFIRVADVKERIDYDGCIRVPEMNSDFDTLKRCHKGDIVLTKGGRVGTAGLIREDSYVTRDMIFINSSKLSRPKYISLYLYFCSDFAYRRMIRSSSMTAQPHLTITMIKDIPIFKFSDALEQKLCCFYEKSELLMQESKSAYSYAESLLKSAINTCTQIPNENHTNKLLTDSFKKTGRLDSEYYQLKYTAYAESLHTDDTVKSLCNIYDSNYIPKASEVYKYIELADVGNSGEIENVESMPGNCLPSRARRIVKSGQVIVSSVEGSLKSCALIDEDFDGAVCSTGFYVLDSKEINSETLLVLFKSETIQALLKQRCSGTILTAINKDEFLSMPLPRIDVDIQTEIALNIQNSFALRNKSKQLLKYAKQAVELAIEKSEKEAIEWLENQE